MSPGELVNIVEFKTLGFIPGATQQLGELRIIDGQRYQVRGAGSGGSTLLACDVFRHELEAGADAWF